MYVELVGLWINGPVPSTTRAVGSAPTPALARIAAPIEWPKGEDGTISLRLIDELGEPVDLTLTGSPPPDKAVLSIGLNFTSGSVRNLTAAAGGDRGQYLFTVAATDTSDMNGPMVYEVCVTKGGKLQRVKPVAYFTVTPSVRS